MCRFSETVSKGKGKEGPSETEVNIICGMKMEIDMKIQNETYLG